jgi:hypothetical protein
MSCCWCGAPYVLCDFERIRNRFHQFKQVSRNGKMLVVTSRGTDLSGEKSS